MDVIIIELTSGDIDGSQRLTVATVVGGFAGAGLNISNNNNDNVGLAVARKF